MASGDALIRSYHEHGPVSGRLIEDARAFMPGGDTRASAHYMPYPLFVDRAAGCRLYTPDGHELVDFMNNFTSLLHGHAFPPVVAAVTEQVARGTAFAAPTTSQVDLARLLCERVPSLELVRFCASGSEATLMTLRCARAATGRQKIMKMEGGYHGSYELAEVSLRPSADARGPLEAPASVPVDASIPDSALDDAVICPFNQPELARALIRRHAEELAAIIVEPALGSMGMIPASRAFLAVLREEATRAGIVLIFDEVITLRLAPGGAQALYGITPDLTAMGKIIGGGLPIGAFGGRADLMALFDPGRAAPVLHASTFSGNPLSMAAGLAAMVPADAATFERLDRLGERFREGVDRVFGQRGIKGCASGVGSLSQIHFTESAVEDARQSYDGMVAAGPVPRWLHLGMLRRGVSSASRLMYCISSPMREAEVDFALDALNDTLGELRPVIEREWPALLR
ncbi:MAG: aspartate aminotransferase family protein [Pseudomonadales bacterium]|jgi:glutamate-1-semialdehyde 2,1-aminomutase|nr:aspartate aminotransferase family protein [Pseudomonadales bacterium]